jgi:hypothetical protein
LIGVATASLGAPPVAVNLAALRGYRRCPKERNADT